MSTKQLLLIVFTSMNLFVLGQKQTTQEYIDKWKDVAVNQMYIHKIPASITLAQGILESGNGNSMLAVKGNNHFGIKCHSTWEGEKIYKDDDKKDECFRKYKSAAESFDDHGDFLQKKRYSPLFELKITDYKGWAKGLKKAGYATNPKYPSLLIGLIERYNLTEYDKQQDVALNTEEVKEPKNEVVDVKEEDVIVIGGGHEVKSSSNNVSYVIIKADDSFAKIASEFDMRLWQLYKYNDFDKNHVLKKGERLYIKPKRCKAKEEYHVVKQGETMKSISQVYAIKLKVLYKKNLMTVGTQPKQGEKLNLRKKKK